MLKAELERRMETQAATITKLVEEVDYYKKQVERLNVENNKLKSRLESYEDKEVETRWSNEMRGKQIEAILEYYQKMVEGGIEEPFTQRIISELIVNNQLIF